MQLIFMLTRNPFPVVTTLVSRARHKHRCHLTCRSDIIHIILDNRLVRSLPYCEECSVLREVQREGHASLKFVLTNR
jgi:hypothetical protein